MSRRPVVSGLAVIKLLESLGYSYVRQHGSHVQMARLDKNDAPPVTVPLHNEVSVGTLYVILDIVSEATDPSATSSLKCRIQTC
ncbi:type II toxin-antitoxin system HicA family toxin [Methanoculleus sp. UBA303]|uniref:type II toxin-antitoxin system HicA family toxin n=1 Tax=Methanoculleus sp. UBA303 TaxID=1915497 RepID=UPI0025CC7E4D|nr:type II toxin-antitoxin system HicA family toxin [Methanoculleus sp. UBA303]